MSEVYRPNAAVIVTDGKGRVLLCQRIEDTLKQHWQVVQGGIDEGETARQAAERELQEELGIAPDSFQILAESREVYRYTWTPEYLASLPPRPFSEQYVGQEQRYFLAQYNGGLADLDLDAHGREFAEVRWGTPQELVDGAWEGKRPGILAALTEFGLLAAE
jgi:putative (di)nucleoside polyphosphate hydrolase